MTYAIYFESKGEDGAVYQSLFCPASRLGDHELRPSLAYKELTPDHPSRTWKVIQDSAYAPSTRQPESVSELMGHELGQVSSLSSYLLGTLSDPDWDLVGSFPVLMSDSIKLEFLENPTRLPAVLAKHIRDNRDRRGWTPLPGKAHQ